MRLDAFRAMLEAVSSVARLASWNDTRSVNDQAETPLSVLLSFDDGDRDTVEHVPSVLEEFGIIGIFFVVTSLIGTEGPLGTVPGIRKFADRGLLQEVAARGHHIGAHGVSHVSLDELPFNRQQDEVVNSLNGIEELIGSRPDSFAYPFGRVPARTSGLGLPTHAFATSGGNPCWRCSPHSIGRRYLPPTRPTEGWKQLVQRNLATWERVNLGHQCDLGASEALVVDGVGDQLGEDA